MRARFLRFALLCLVPALPASSAGRSSSHERIQLSTSERPQRGHVYTGQTFRVPSERLKLLAAPPENPSWPVAVDESGIFVPNFGILNIYDATQDHWTTEPLGTSGPVKAAAKLANQLYMILDTYPVPQTNLTIYDLASHAISGQLALPQPDDNDYVALHAAGDTLHYLVNHNNGANQYTLTPFTYTNGSGWSTDTPAMPFSADGYQSCADATQVFVLSQPTHVGIQPQDRFLRYDSVSKTWTQLAPPPTVGAMALHDGKVFVADSVLYCYDIQQGKWSVAESYYPQGLTGWLNGGFVDLRVDRLQWYNATYLELFVHQHK
jgi:hypothetical protein